ncbi:protease complex subunit PrcB family protein [Aminipila butyrica]|uniref:Protease complex subunit PrcB family protein n=1 Tax=Aminipila butyrica TaxID=433296 RepID=A0A858BW59_9FIRM|nr:protease complex subunit PrcB family protein [Aminipila butyrica]QIB69140.1 protease complex subunit PrcB family protein [Aminipila butyrica]
MSENKFLKKIKWPSKKVLIIGLVIVIAVVAGIFIMGNLNGAETVKFKVLGDNEIPQDIVGQVIPEYRDLERALACMVDDKVYVLVSRGEKPTSGFAVTIDRMLVEEKDGVTNLAVYAKFADPEPGVALTQILTYPLQVAETGLTTLPDQIELRVQYK